MVNKWFKYGLVLLIIIKLVFLVLNPYFVSDEYAHLHAASYLKETGDIGFQGNEINGFHLPHYPPLFHMILASLMYIFSISVVRYIVIIGVGIGLYIAFYNVFKFYIPEKYCSFGSLFILLNPMVFLWSSLLYTEGIFLMFMMASIWMLHEKRYDLSLILFMLSGLVKPYLVFLYVIFFIVYAIQKKEKQALKPLIVLLPLGIIYYLLMEPSMFIGFVDIFKTHINSRVVTVFGFYTVFAIFLAVFWLFTKKDLLPFIAVLFVMTIFYFSYNEMLGIRWFYYLMSVGYIILIRNMYVVSERIKFKKEWVFIGLFIIMFVANVTFFDDIFEWQLREDYFVAMKWVDTLPIGVMFTPLPAETLWYASDMNYENDLKYFYNLTLFENIDYIFVPKVWIGSYWFPRNMSHGFYEMLDSPCFKEIYENNLTLIYNRTCDNFIY